MSKQAEKTQTVEHINPETMHQNPAFTNVVIVSGAAKTVYIGGQNAVDAKGNIVGKGDLKAQTEHTFKNLKTCLDAAGAKLENIVKWNIYVVQGQPIQQGLEVFQKVWDKKDKPPVITMNFVAGLGNPDFLVEIDAIAVLPDEN